ncbi:threonine--tRNA ligase [Ignavibacteria bacterium CHB1]|nr:MAG: threonine--tRNA ligase [Chlorobiota bacterium]MBW7856458.1 threonine--tRNA ligase [Ignavibacteria bacterium]MCE7953429.1 threonine--tRNA ligase [Chlorobi bacterium CHB7]MDL1887365.1 threonine--tRNA ligase [Ignavibacteria bacterium CHB1]OQY78690.1 MAG: threonine--tRNA ligase [Ignavibacteriales bacterium UTCHB1]RIK48740.1 MAG: threonine--tRNA ligase [Ignavibacteriota bacterium]
MDKKINLPNKIKIKFPDGAIKEFDSGVSSFQIAESISPRFADEVLVAEINGNMKDLSAPVSEDAEIKFHKFDSEKGKEVYWHTTSHMMAQAIEELFPGAKFGVGPPIENGFYYDIDSEHKFSDKELEMIETRIHEIAERDLKPVREEIPRLAAIEYFKTKRVDPYKVEILEDIAKDQDVVSLYHQGEFTDLCRGPHLPSTGKVKSVKLLSVSGSYWRGDEKRKILQRIYGISFPKKKLLDEYIKRLEEAKKRDHRKLGQELELFLISQKVGGGLPLWLPNGAIVRNELEKFLKEEQIKRGYEPVYTPHIAKIDLYKQSGHYPYYKDSQYPPIDFVDETGKVEQYLLKPMNCPHHHQIYLSKPRSYRDLPVRLAEFGTVYRYEQSGELNGLIRVRGFTQDDSHIYCRHDQLLDEICNVIELNRLVFDTFGFSEVRTRLSFRDKQNKEKYGGEDTLWDEAEKNIRDAADKMKINYFIGLGEASFYGPKLDFMVKDAIGREWQLGTVQVDYVMPERFDLNYVGTDGQKHRPVIIHRAPFGSMERFIGILIENFTGYFPLWLAPVQVIVLPVSENSLDYATKVYAELEHSGFRAKLDDRSEKIGYKIRDAETKKVPFMVIVGDKEKLNKSISVRKHKDGDLGSFELNEFIEKIKLDVLNKTIYL